MAYGSKTISTAATQIIEANCARRSLTLANLSEGTIVYIGPDNAITTSNAMPLYETQTTHKDNFPESYKGPIFGITPSGTADVRYWESIQ